MELWQKRLEHLRVVRDGYVACGNKKVSEEEDQPGSYVPVGFIQRFDGKIFFPFIEAKGHNSAEFSTCKCCAEERRSGVRL